MSGWAAADGSPAAGHEASVSDGTIHIYRGLGGGLDLLSNAASLAVLHVRLADLVEDLGLACSTHPEACEDPRRTGS